ncbi:MAG: chromosome partitioning protein ParB [Alphaproteobacteria bacterium 64-11]|nr:ParB/RepB/Spo0J family partition protein [Alphaproteobacteria bacterium]OJU09078.1 MAG: chromosome partitioning protein ParB [Alphaproteobacteria bacterium 64-11]
MNPPPPADRPRGLGRGLSALIGDEVAAVKGEPARAKDTRSLPVAFLRPGKYQPRKSFDEQPLADLAASIKEKGVLSPILVRPIGPDSYEIVAGERRWRAAQMAKLHDVPVVVRELPDDQALEIAIIENVQRADLNVIEEASAYEELIEKFGRTQDDVAREVGKSRSHIANTIRLLRLPDAVKALLREGKLTAGHARTLIGEPDPYARAMELIAGELTVREAEQRSPKKHKPGGKPPRDPNIVDLESSISNKLGLKVHITHNGDEGGEVRIGYKTLEQLDELTRRLSGGR